MLSYCWFLYNFFAYWKTWRSSNDWQFPKFGICWPDNLIRIDRWVFIEGLSPPSPWWKFFCKNAIFLYIRPATRQSAPPFTGISLYAPVRINPAPDARIFVWVGSLEYRNLYVEVAYFIYFFRDTWRKKERERGRDTYRETETVTENEGFKP